MEQTTLPRLSACIEMYYAAYGQHGTAPFRAEELGWNRLDVGKQHGLELAVAYGLLTSDGSTYQLRCAPDASQACWASSASDRAERIGHAVTEYAEDAGDDGGRPVLTHGGDRYASVTVGSSEDFPAVSESVSAVSVDEYDGVVLRSPGDYANEVQRFADRLCRPSDESEPPVSTLFDKEYSDVRGASKDGLEFRIFLRTT